MPSEIPRLRELEDENRQPEKTFVDLRIDREMLLGIIRQKAMNPDWKRELIEGRLLALSVAIGDPLRTIAALN